MKKLPDCYGTYGTSHCAECEYAEYCVDAGDPTTTDARYNTFVLNESMITAGYYDSLEDEGSNLSKLLGELIYELEAERADLLWDFLATMSALSKEHPRTYSVVRLRVLYPRETYESLARRLGTSRQNVENHLKHAVELVPKLKDAVPPPAERLAKPKVNHIDVRCSGNKLHLLMDDERILTMEYNDINGVNLPLLSSALNNLHWRHFKTLKNSIEKRRK